MTPNNGLEDKANSVTADSMARQFDIDSGRVWLSMAISLKRIADLLYFAKGVAIAYVVITVIATVLAHILHL